MQNNFSHTFHIPVMGLAYTINSPIKVARFGISSAMSIIEDRLVEFMRKHYYAEVRKPFHPISEKEPDYRAKRITDYLNLVNEIVTNQFDKLRASSLADGGELSKYFLMLPDGNLLRKIYLQWQNVVSPKKKNSLEQYLKRSMQSGGIDVNIMTKVDKNNFDKDGNLLKDSSDAVAALRGYINSDLTNSSVIFSAGLNPRLYNYLETVTAFDAKGLGVFDKKVVIKVSDYRSALIQGKYLAKKAI